MRLISHHSTNRPETVVFPPRQPNTEHVNVTTDTGVIVLVGANGSGKSRMGAWIESSLIQSGPVHRVSAQKVIELPKTITAESLSQSKFAFLYGHPELQKYINDLPNLYHMRLAHRWGQSPTSHTLNDFPRLLTYLFTEHSDVSSHYLELSQKTTTRVEPPQTRLQQVKRIWETALPHRTLEIGGFELYTELPERMVRYHASEMSDGERVIFYLAGECIAAEPGSIVIVDEPEIHIHRSIQSRLWSAIETARPDCIFVYLTHDLGFAATRTGATKIVVEAFDGAGWQWTQLPSLDDLPEIVMLEIVGSRKPILFCEGELNSLDYLVYSRVYPDYTVIPLGSCEHVIHATRSFESVPLLHNYRVIGIVDRDQRTVQEIESLEAHSVKVLQYSEIENLFLAPSVLGLIATELRLKSEEIVNGVIHSILMHIEKNQEQLILDIAASRFERIVNRCSLNRRNRTEFRQSSDSVRISLDTEALLLEAQSLVEQIIRDKDYIQAIQVYANKGLIRMISSDFGLASGSFPEYIMRILKQETNHQALVLAFQELLPKLPEPTIRLP